MNDDLNANLGYRILEEEVNEDGHRVITKAIATDASFDLTDEGATIFSDMMADPGPVDLIMYAPADLPWWKDWYWRLRGRLFGDPYPQEVIAKGKAYMDGTVIGMPDGRTKVEGKFRSSGKWEIKP